MNKEDVIAYFWLAGLVLIFFLALDPLLMGLISMSLLAIYKILT